MSKIKSILHTEIKLRPDGNQYLLVNVLLTDGTEAVVVVGGEVEVFFHRGRIKAFIKRAQNLTK